MICQNIYCIYNSEEKCIIDSIELDVQGKCTSCEYVEIEDKYLNQKKQEALARYDE